MDEWHIGDPVDWGDGWMDAQNWGHGQDDDDKKISSSYNDSEYQHILEKQRNVLAEAIIQKR